MKHFDLPATDALRDAYNQHYSEPADYWSVHDLSITHKIVLKIVKVLRKLEFHLPDHKKLLDVGCAKGHFSAAWRRNGFSVTGTDISDVAISLAIKNFPEIKFTVSDGMKPDVAEKYDVIFIRHFSGFSTHHIDYVIGLLNKYFGMLSKSGVLLIAMSTNLSGQEKENEMVNWDADEIAQIKKAIPGFITSAFPEESRSQQILQRVLRTIGPIGNNKRCHYLFFKKET